VNDRETELKAAAFDAAGAGLEVREAGGAPRLANAAAGAGVGPLGDERRLERLVEGRARLIERRNFAFEGRPYSVIAAMDIDAARRLQDELYARAYFDASTGLPNRELCDRAIAEQIDAGAAPFAVVAVEIEAFAEIVAFHGPAAGEALAARIGERLGRLASSPRDLLARVDANAFCFIAASPGDDEELGESCRRLAARASEPCLIDGAEIFADASVGACVWPTGDARPEGLRRKAHAAAREARRIGVSSLLFASEIEEREAERSRQDTALRQAIRDRRVGCAFQPKVDIRSGEVDSLEVLMRWRGEDGGWSTPGQLLSLAHEVGLTGEVTMLVLEETLASLDAINAAFGQAPKLGFNISAKLACDARFMRGFLDTLIASGRASRFMLEITEEAFLPAGHFQERILPMIRETGAHISIDDFGAGYSSLATLADITADEVKVDRSLIVDIDRRPRSQSLLRAIESIGLALETEVIVEGVETEAEFAYLRDHTGIRVAQGFYFGKPVMLSGIVGGTEARERKHPAARGGERGRGGRLL
jgi:predicted signal transduction protein with EAL and GGDEF domain